MKEKKIRARMRVAMASDRRPNARAIDRARAFGTSTWSAVWIRMTNRDWWNAWTAANASRRDERTRT